MIDNNNLLSSAKQLIARNELEKAFNLIEKALVNRNGSSENELIILRQSYSSIRKKIILGIDNSETEWNKLSYRTLVYIDSISSSKGIVNQAKKENEVFKSSKFAKLDKNWGQDAAIELSLESRIENIKGKLNSYYKKSVRDVFMSSSYDNLFLKFIIGIYYIWFLFFSKFEGSILLIYFTIPIVIWILIYSSQRIIINRLPESKLVNAYEKDDFRSMIKYADIVITKETDFEKISFLFFIKAHATFHLDNIDESFMILSKIYSMLEEKLNLFNINILATCFEYSAKIEMKKQNAGLASLYFLSAYKINGDFENFKHLHDIFTKENANSKLKQLFKFAIKKTNDPTEWEEIKRMELLSLKTK